jgi:hypothetical protein
MVKAQKVYPGEVIEQGQKGKKSKPVEMPYYTKRKNPKRFLAAQRKGQEQMQEEQAQRLDAVSAKRQRQLFGERQTMPTDPALLQAMAARQAAIPGQEDIMKETFLQKLLTPQEYESYRQGKQAKTAEKEAIKKAILREPEITKKDIANIRSTLGQIAGRKDIGEEKKTQLEQFEQRLKNMDKDQFKAIAEANNVSIPAKKDNRKGAIGKLKNLFSQGQFAMPGGPGGDEGEGLKFKRGRKTKDIEGKGFLGDLFRSAKNKIVEAVKSDPIGATKKAFELAQKGIKGAQEAKKMATQFGLIKPKPALAQEEAKGSGLKRGRGRPKKQVKGGDFASHLLSSGFHTMFDPLINKGKEFIQDPLTQQALGIYKELTGGKLKVRGKQHNFKQALEDYKKVQNNQKKNMRKRII